MSHGPPETSVALALESSSKFNDTLTPFIAAYSITMELRRAAEVLIGSQASPLSFLISPAATSRWAAGTNLCHRIANFRPTHRTMSNSARNDSLRPQPTTSAAPSEPKDSSAPSSSIDDLSQSLWTSPSRKPIARLDPEREKRFNGGSSAADLLAALNSAPGTRSSSRFDAHRMLDPLNDNKSMMSGAAAALSIPKTPKFPMRLTPSTGRSIAVGTGIDVARGLRLLEQSCARNRVRADFSAQRFHERGGLKRKRLRRQRWRRRFMEGFRATVGRVKQLKNQGW